MTKKDRELLSALEKRVEELTTALNKQTSPKHHYIVWQNTSACLKPVYEFYSTAIIKEKDEIRLLLPGSAKGYIVQAVSYFPEVDVHVILIDEPEYRNEFNLGVEGNINRFLIRRKNDKEG